MRCHLLEIQRPLYGFIFGITTLEVFYVVLCVQKQLESLQDGGMAVWKLYKKMLAREKRQRRKYIRIQNRSGVGRLLLYGVHKDVSRAAAYLSDLACKDLLENRQGEGAFGKTSSGLLNRIGH